MRKMVKQVLVLVLAFAFLFAGLFYFSGKLTGFAVFTSGPGEGQTTLTLQEADSENLDDAYVDSGTANKNRGINEDLNVQRNPYQRIYIKFDISQIPSGQMINDSKLCLYLHNDQGTQTVSASHVYVSDWNEGSEDGTDVSGQDYTTNITWNNQPCGADFDNSVNCNLTAESSISDDGTFDNTWQCWTVTNAVLSEYGSGADSVSIVLYTNDLGNADLFHSKEYSGSSLRPYLNVTYHSADITAPDVSFTSSTTSEGEHNQDSINVAVSVDDENSVYSFINFDSSLFAFYKLNESSGTVVDYSGYGKGGMIQGPVSAQGKFGSALSFDGIDDRISLTSTVDTGNKWTFSAWVYQGTSYMGWKNILSSPVPNTAPLTIYGRKLGNYDCNLYALNTMPTQTWHHVLITSDGNEMWAYADNSLVVSGACNKTYSITKIGSNYLGSQQFFNGIIDEVLIFNRTLSVAEIEALYNAGIYSHNFTNLDLGEHDFYAYAQDEAGNEAQTETRTVTLVANTAPSVGIVLPSDGSVYGYNESIALEFSVSDFEDNLDRCWYNLDNGENVSLTDCENTSFDVSEGNHEIFVYANDTAGLTGSDSSSFSVAVGAPSIALNSPINGSYTNSHDVEFFYTATDIDLDSCELWGDFSGVFALNQTDLSVVSGEQSTFDLNLDDGVYVWNVRCNDSQGNFVFNGNKTFVVDTTAPLLSISEPSGTKSLRTGVPLNFNVDDLNVGGCWFNVYRGASLEVANTTVDCATGSSTFDVTVDATFVLTVYANDSAGNLNWINSSFSVSPSAPPASEETEPSSGGGGWKPRSESTNEVRTVKLDFSGLEDISSKIGEEKEITLQVVNRDLNFLNNCKLTFSGDAGSWFSNGDSKGLSKGEKYSFLVNLKIPNNVEPGNYNPHLTINCDEGQAKTVLTLAAYKNDFDIEILDYEKSGANLRVDTRLSENGAVIRNLKLQYILVDLEGFVKYSGEKNINLNALEEREEIIEFELPKDSFGEFDFRVKLSEGETETINNKKIFLPSQTGLAGFAISDDNKRTLSYLGAGIIILVLLIVIVYSIRKMNRKKKKKEILSSKFGRGHRQLVEIEL